MDTLKFLGTGSGFNPSLGSTSAYFIEGDTLFLIDCGESAYGRIMELNLLDGIKCVNLFVTHTHSDHIGSVGSLLLECKHIRNIAFNLICSPNEEHFADIIAILNAFGGRSSYSVISPDNIENVYKSFNKVCYEKANHVSQISSYNLVFYTDEGAVYYSGDCADMGYADILIMSGLKIKAMYFDVSGDTENKFHLPIVTLYRLIPEAFRTRIYCMHLDSEKCIFMAKSMGFNVATAETKSTPEE